jgi:hypothetical protein
MLEAILVTWALVSIVGSLAFGRMIGRTSREINVPRVVLSEVHDRAPRGRAA